MAASRFISHAAIGLLQGMGMALSAGAAEPPVTQPDRPAATLPAPTTATQPASTTRPFNLLTAETLTGNWGGVRTDLENLGISFRTVYQQQAMVNMLGGVETKNGHDFAGSYDSNILFDFDRMFGLSDAEGFFRAKGTWGGDDSDFDNEKIGGLFRTNGDGAPEEPVFVDKWWYRQRWLEDRLEIRLGRLESAKDLIDVSSIAGTEDEQFLNRALVTNQAIPHRTGLGLFLKAWPADWLYVAGAVVDADTRPRRTGFDTTFHGPDRFNAYWELGLVPAWLSRNGTLDGVYRFGGWYDASPKDVYMNTLDGYRRQQTETGDVGFYFGFDQMIWKENKPRADRQGLSLFGRYGYAPARVNEIEHFWATGGQYEGLIPTRDEDVLGLAMAQGVLSRALREHVNPKADRETVFELYYAIRLTPWCVLSPDLQVVTNPGGNTTDRDTVIFGLRVRFNL